MEAFATDIRDLSQTLGSQTNSSMMFSEIVQGEADKALGGPSTPAVHIPYRRSGEAPDHVHLTKRVALEQLLWRAVEFTVAGPPALVFAVREKPEDGKARLLLSSDTLHYITYSMVFDLDEQNLARDKRIDYPVDGAEEYAKHSLRSRLVNREYGYEDSNSQHSNLSMTISHLTLVKAYLALTEASGGPLLGSELLPLPG
eukprot:Skav209136  [mRNA]  locus=scaffold3950:136355:136954:- [translate_table: standard]